MALLNLSQSGNAKTTQGVANLTMTYNVFLFVAISCDANASSPTRLSPLVVEDDDLSRKRLWRTGANAPALLAISFLKPPAN